jgi:hypothetical protein
MNSFNLKTLHSNGNDELHNIIVTFKMSQTEEKSRGKMKTSDFQLINDFCI